jgi:hypothetical protein
MANNPLKKYFRQPKIYVDLPSKGIYSEPGSLMGDPENMPIYGMTGMDEIIMKTPDALLRGESTVKVIESCCPVVKNAWDVSILDLDLLMVAIRIATYGNTMTVTHKCPHCEAENDFEIELGNIINHFKQCVYDGKIVLKDLIINLRPLSYKSWSEFQIRSFGIQRQISQATRLEDQDEAQRVVAGLFEQITELQRETIIAQIDSVEVTEGVVDQKAYIQEWVENSEQLIFDEIKKRIESNRKLWEIPELAVTCPDCTKDSTVAITVDQSDFFARA